MIRCTDICYGKTRVTALRDSETCKSTIVEHCQHTSSSSVWAGSPGNDKQFPLIDQLWVLVLSLAECALNRADFGVETQSSVWAHHHWVAVLTVYSHTEHTTGQHTTRQELSAIPMGMIILSTTTTTKTMNSYSTTTSQQLKRAPTYMYCRLSTYMYCPLSTLMLVHPLVLLTYETFINTILTLWRPLLLYGYSYKASCVRPG